MVSASEMRKINRMVSCIKQHGDIHKFDMIDECGISIRDFYQLKGYMERKHEGIIKYNKSNGYYMNIAKTIEYEQQQKIDTN